MIFNITFIKDGEKKKVYVSTDDARRAVKKVQLMYDLNPEDILNVEESKLTQEDIEKYGTEDEKKILEKKKVPPMLKRIWAKKKKK